MTSTMVLFAEIMDTVSEISWHFLPQQISKTRDKIKHGQGRKRAKSCCGQADGGHQSWGQGSDSQLPTAWHWHRKAYRLNKLDFPLQITAIQIRKNGSYCLLRILIHQDVTKCQTAQHVFLLLSNTFHELSSFKATALIDCSVILAKAGTTSQVSTGFTPHFKGITDFWMGCRHYQG